MTLFGGLCGYSIAEYSARFYQTLTTTQMYTNHVALILLGVLLGWALTPIAANLALAGVESISVGLQHLSLQEVLMGSAGLLFGLIVAFFTNLALQQINFAAIPAVGPYIGPFLVVLSTIFLGLLGAFFGSRLVFIHSFRELLATGSEARSWGSRFCILDTSVVIDGRLQPLVETGFLEGTLVVPQFVLAELQALSDSEDALKRSRGRRGLDALNKLRQRMGLEVENKDYEDRGVDSKLVRLAKDMKGVIVTTDYNLQKVATLQNVKVLNVNELAASLRPLVLPGEEMVVKLIREGKESHQAVGYLEDGTMIVVERGRKWVGKSVLAEVTSVVQTASGKMVFARFRQLAQASSEVPTDSGEVDLSPKSSAPKVNGNIAKSGEEINDSGVLEGIS